MAYTTINKSTDYFNTKLYAGNSGTQSITGVNFQPDFLWIKRRNLAGDHNLVDVIRTSDKTLISNSTGAEYSNSTITSFDSDGFSLSGSDGALNASGSNYVSWNWKANGAGSANYDGSISSTVSANTTAGFSVVSWSGTGSNGTIGHGLGATPGLMIIKNRNNIGEWRVWNSTFNADQYLYLNRNDAVATQSILFNSTLPTSSVISAGTSGDINASGRTYIAYCFAEKTGYSKFGSYTGNGSNDGTDGTFVYTGFKPAFVMLKRTDSLGSWFMFDNKRLGYNSDSYRLIAETTDTEANPGGYDLLSNGFKLRFTSGNANGSGGSYIYMAFASAPIVGTNNIPATAR
jgi:hypothetical protein